MARWALTLVFDCANHSYRLGRHPRQKSRAPTQPYLAERGRERGTTQDCGGVHSRGLSYVTFYLLGLMKPVEGLVQATLEKVSLGVELQLGQGEFLGAELAA